MCSTGNLFVVNPDGSGLRQVTRVAANQCAANPTWSPDGKRIAFQLITSRRQVLQLMDLVTLNMVSDIWTVASDGSGLTQLTRDGRSAEPRGARDPTILVVCGFSTCREGGYRMPIR